MNSIIFYYCRWDGRRLAYSSITHFLIQIGRRDGSFHTRKEVIGNFQEALTKYRDQRIDPGWKKRLYMPTSKRDSILAHDYA